MKILFSHPTGNANVRAAAKGFAEAGLLDQFYTCIAAFPNSWIDKLGQIPGFGEIKRRRFDPVLKPYTEMVPYREMGRLLSSKFGLSSFLTHETGLFCIDQVYNHLDKHIAKKTHLLAKSGANGIYGYDDGSYYSFMAAKKSNLLCLYDLPTGHWRAARKLLEIEKERHPEWIPTMSGFKDSSKKLKKKDTELALADHIYVASSFTASTLNEYPGKLSNISVIPYGFPEIANKRTYNKILNKKLKILFVGKLTQQKGLATLLEAITTIEGKIDLTIVGRKPNDNCKPLNKSLSKHKWIPSLAHKDILALMQTQDIFIFPTLFDGFGMVMTEAMSQGTPVIATERCAAPDLIKHGENGWIVEAGSSESLKAQLEEILLNPEKVKSVGQAAMETALKRPWETYGREMAESVQKLILD